MKVLMTADAVGGVWTYAMELARGLSASGCQLTLAVLGPSPTAAQRAEARAVDGLMFVEHRGRLEWMDDPWADVDAAGEWLLRIAKNTSPDIVHINGYAHAALPYGVPTVVVGHSCVESWWRAVKGGPAPERFDEYRARVAGGLRAAAAIAAPTRAMADSLRECHHVQRSICIIPNGRDDGMFQPATKSPLILSAGRLWDEAKNVAALQRVAPRLPWPVYVAGPQRDTAGGCISVGALDGSEMATWMSRAAIFVSAAHYEPFGLCVLEAALCGCALVLADIPSFRELWSGAAWLVPPNDDEELAAALRTLAGHDELRQAYQRQALDRAAEYSTSRMLAGCLQMYQGAQHARGKGPRACES